jgi:alkanesulfonate monooxygenase SsuD/methylene tetrahydromethanopterin reductase-like flavin-dependent oxidoreductase (luciferase family)
MSISFGIFDSFDQGNHESGQLLRDRLDFAVEAERLGIEHYHVTEHHGTPLSVCPSPNLFLAALSQRTTTIRIGALVYVLPAYQNVRLAEEIATLDQLSNGRVDLGVGAGINPYEIELLGADPDRAREIYEQMLPQLLEGLRTGDMPSGTVGSSEVAHLSIEPIQRPYPPLWYASSNTKSVEWAGANAINLVGRWASGTFPDAASAYWAALNESADRQDSRLNPGVDAPLLGVSAITLIGESEAAAMDRFEAAYGSFGASVSHMWLAHDDHRGDTFASGAASLENGTAIVGTAASVRDQVIAQVEGANLNYFETMLAFGDMTADESLTNLRTFASEVMPAVRETAGRRGSLVS